MVATPAPISGLNPGTYTVTACYPGNGNNPGGTSAPITVTVNAFMNATCGNATLTYRGNCLCTIKFGSSIGRAAGSVTYAFDGDTPVSVPLSQGAGPFTLALPNVCSHTVITTYPAQGVFSSSGPTTHNFTVSQATIKITPGGVELGAGAPGSRAVTFYDVPLGSFPVNAQSPASTTFNIGAEKHPYTAQFSGTSPKWASSCAVVITVTAH